MLSRRSAAIRERTNAMSRQRRTLLGSVALLGSAAVLLAGLYGIQQAGGIADSALRPWAWGATTVLGLFFVHMQVLGAGAMVSLVQEGEYIRRHAASNSQENP